jgi:SAM-dependent methyltransferase
MLDTVTDRMTDVASLLAEIIADRASGAPLVVAVRGSGAPAFASALAPFLAAPVTVRPDGPGDLLIHLRGGRGSGGSTAPGSGSSAPGPGSTAPGPGSSAAGPGDGEFDADVVIDHHDPAWPVIRRIRPGLADLERWYVRECRAFFGARAAEWDTRFGDDLPSYARAVADAGVRPGAIVADVGCGTGRALTALAAAAGPTGRVLGLDLTPDMLTEARRAGRDALAALGLADARRLPLRDASLDVVFAAGLVQHLPDPAAGLAELARVVRPGGRLAVFHPSGRAALAARHGRSLRADEPLSAGRFGPLLASAGWHLTRYDDADDHFFALADRT